jgi:hypothetical protein
MINKISKIIMLGAIALMSMHQLKAVVTAKKKSAASTAQGVQLSLSAQRIGRAQATIVAMMSTVIFYKSLSQVRQPITKSSKPKGTAEEGYTTLNTIKDNLLPALQANKDYANLSAAEKETVYNNLKNQTSTIISGIAASTVALINTSKEVQAIAKKIKNLSDNEIKDVTRIATAFVPMVLEGLSRASANDTTPTVASPVISK